VKKLKETLYTLLLATRYSFAFCWKNNKFDTTARLFVAIANTVLLYGTVYATGSIVSAAQLVAKKKTANMTFAEFITGSLYGPTVLLVGILFAGVFIGRLNWYFRNRWSQQLRHANELEINNHRAKLDVARFKSKMYDDLEKRISELPSSWQTRIWFSDEMFNLLTTLVSFCLFGASLITLKPWYALILVVTAIPMAFVEFQFVIKWWDLFLELVPHHKKRRVMEKPYRNTNAFIQALMFNQMPILGKEVEKNHNEVLGKYDTVRKENVLKETFTHFLAMTGLCCVTIHAIWQVVSTGGEIGTLTVIIAAARIFQSNLDTIVALIAEQWNSAKGVILTEEDFLRLGPVLKTIDPVVPHFNGPPHVRFEKVSFAYPDTDTLVLKNVSFSIEPGTKVAIVGKSGNGKSSIASLMMRHYDPTSGDIYVGDINLRNILPEVWTDTASALMQDYAVHERTIAGEIASSRPDREVDMEVVAESARFSCFAEVVNSDPKGYESQIGTDFGGREFSGGERQRLALARVRYRGTPVLILDEPDAKLDPESAQKVMDHIFALKGITVIIITHHVSRAERCDRVIVMGKGEVAEQGSHEELMSKKDGIYASMFEKDRRRLEGSTH